MTNKPENTPENLDERLAAFADQVLAAPDQTGADSSTSTPLDADDPELLELERTVLRLKTAFPTEQARPSFQTSLRLRMATQWRQQQTLKRLPWWQRFIPARPAPRLTLAFAVASLLLAVVALLIPVDDVPLTGAAGGSTAPILGVVALVMVFLTIWLLRDKK